MYKVSLGIGAVNFNMKLAVSTMISNEGPSVMAKYQESTIRNFRWNGNEYLKLMPHPFVTIDISKPDDKGENYNANSIVNVNVRQKFTLVQALENMIEGFQVKDLFYLKDGKLYVKPTVGEELSEIVPLQHKTVKMYHAVVPSMPGGECDTEGIIFMINSADNFAYLTYEDTCFLHDILSRMDMGVYGGVLIDIYLSHMDLASTMQRPAEGSVRTFATQQLSRIPNQLDSSYIRVEPVQNQLPNI